MKHLFRRVTSGAQQQEERKGQTAFGLTGAAARPWCGSRDVLWCRRFCHAQPGDALCDDASSPRCSAARRQPGFHLPCARKRGCRRIGVLNSLSFIPILDRLEAFFEEIEAGCCGSEPIGQFRSAEGRSDLLRLAAELVGHNVKVIICLTSASTVRAARLATSTIPIVLPCRGDPIELRLTENFSLDSHGNVTEAGRRARAQPRRLGVILRTGLERRRLGFC